ncbi:hypothetical protein FB451DRAFT_1187616 [Mycena latifolia]|nr:hypothetical protein FB451DRAFT_1187616 [Mycena latifolia]
MRSFRLGAAASALRTWFGHLGHPRPQPRWVSRCPCRLDEARAATALRDVSENSDIGLSMDVRKRKIKGRRDSGGRRVSPEPWFGDLGQTRTQRGHVDLTRRQLEALGARWSWGRLRSKWRLAGAAPALVAALHGASQTPGRSRIAPAKASASGIWRAVFCAHERFGAVVGPSGAHQYPRWRSAASSKHILTTFEEMQSLEDHGLDDFRG